MAKLGIAINITSDVTKQIDVSKLDAGSFDKGATPFVFATGKEMGNATSASGFFGKTKVGVVINEFANPGEKVLATHEMLHILRGDLTAGRPYWRNEINTHWETFRLEHGWTNGMGWLTDSAKSFAGHQ